MADTLFIDGSTVISAEWLNEVNRHVFDSGAIYASEYDTLQEAITAAYGKRLVLESGHTYEVSSEVQISDSIEIVTSGAEPAIIEKATNSGITLDVGSSTTFLSTTLAANARVNAKTITVTDATGVTAGMLVYLQSTKAWYHDPREATSISPDTDAAGTAQGGSTSTITLKAGTTHTDFTGLAVTIESGTGAGQARVVQSYNSTTKVCTMTSNWKTAPDSTSVYRFPQLFKGELHLVRAVSGTTIELDGQLFDGYDVVDDTYGDGLEAVTVSFWETFKVKIDNIHIKMPATNGADSTGLRCLRMLEPEISRVRVENGTSSGINMSACYKPHVYKPNIRGANDTSTGYGVSFTGCTYPLVEYGDMYNCRRGVDFSGTIPTSYGVCQFNTVLGGGNQEDGTAYNPLGAVENFGVGSHGTARGTVYRCNRIGGVSRAFMIRGRNERAVDNEIIGDIYTAVAFLAYGCNFEITGTRYYNGYTEGSLTSGNQIETNSFEATNINNYTTPYFVYVTSTWERGHTDIINNTVRSLSGFLLYFSSDGDKYDFTVKGNNVIFQPSSVANSCGLVGAASATTNLRNFVEGGNTILGSNSVAEINTFGQNITLNATTGVVSQIGTPTVKTMFLDDDEAGKFRVGQRGNALWFGLIAQNSQANRFFGYLLKNSASPIEMGASTGVGGLATAPSGTTGTDAQVNLHYDGEFLHIENRSGASRDFHIFIIPME